MWEKSDGQRYVTSPKNIVELKLRRSVKGRIQLDIYSTFQSEGRFCHSEIVELQNRQTDKLNYTNSNPGNPLIILRWM